MSDKAEMLPGLAERSLVHRWAGIYPTIFCKGIPLKTRKDVKYSDDSAKVFIVL